MNAQDCWESWDQDRGSGSDQEQDRATAKESRRQLGRAWVGAQVPEKDPD